MAPKELPSQVGEAMLLNGAVVMFGPEYLENSLAMLAEFKDALAGKAVLSCEKIDDLRIPAGPALNCLMIFFHRLPAGMSASSWQAVLLKGIDLRSRPPKGLGVYDKSPEEPKMELIPAGREMQLMLTWTRPLESRHFVETARAIERSYLENGGQFGKPGVFKRLRNLFF